MCILIQHVDVCLRLCLCVCMRVCVCARMRLRCRRAGNDTATTASSEGQRQPQMGGVKWNVFDTSILYLVYVSQSRPQSINARAFVCFQGVACFASWSDSQASSLLLLLLLFALDVFSSTTTLAASLPGRTAACKPDQHCHQGQNHRERVGRRGLLRR